MLVFYFESMKITVDFSNSELKEICLFTGEAKKGPAIRKIVTDALMMKRRAKIARKFISGEWGVELDGYERAKSRDRESRKKRAQV